MGEAPHLLLGVHLWRGRVLHVDARSVRRILLPARADRENALQWPGRSPAAERRRVRGRRVRWRHPSGDRHVLGRHGCAREGWRVGRAWRGARGERNAASADDLISLGGLDTWQTLHYGTLGLGSGRDAGGYAACLAGVEESSAPRWHRVERAVTMHGERRSAGLPNGPA